MDKLRALYRLVASAEFKLKINNREIHPYIAYLIMILGAIKLIQKLNTAY